MHDSRIHVRIHTRDTNQHTPHCTGSFILRSIYSRHLYRQYLRLLVISVAETPVHSFCMREYELHICMYASGCHSIIGIIDQKICETWKIEWNSIMVGKYLCVWMCIRYMRWPKIYKLAILPTKCHQFWAFLPDISSESIPANKILFVDHTQFTQFNYINSDCKPFTEIELHSCSACVFLL